MSTALIVVLVVLAIVALLLAAAAVFTSRTVRKVEAALPPQGRFADVRGCRLHYVDRGSGPVLLFVHGLMGQLGHFTYSLVDALARDHRVIAVDRPGSGYSTRPSSASATLTTQAETLDAFLDALGVREAVVVGHSLGGALALTLALNRPGRIVAVALISPLTHPMTEVPAAFTALAIRWAAWRMLMARTLAVPTAIVRRDALLASVFGPEAAPADYGVRGGGLLGLRPSHIDAASYDMLALEHELPALQQRYRMLTLPVAVLYGRHDRILDHRKHGEALRDANPHVELTLVDGGHMLPITAPRVVEQWLRAFLARVDATRNATSEPLRDKIGP